MLKGRNLINLKSKFFSNKKFTTSDASINPPVEEKNIKYRENIFTHLNERNLVNNISHNELLNKETNIKSFLKENPKVYIGFDPTAESLHLGNLIGILNAVRFGAFGIEPVFLIGGATGQIGDPSGKNKERPLLHKEKVENNLLLMQDNLKSFLDQIMTFADFRSFCLEKSIYKINNNEKLFPSAKNLNSSSGSDEDERILVIERELKKMRGMNNNNNSENLLNLSNTSNTYNDFLKSLELAKSGKSEKLEKSEKTIPSKINIKSFENELFNYTIVNNYEFYKDLNIIDFLRDVGTNLRMGPLLSRETVKNRLIAKEGISLTEFMYQTFQGYDFLRLYEKYNVKIQIGGSDQWGNMLAGYELVKKMKNSEVVTMTFPLMTTANGTKFGKTEGNALFINPKLTPINCIYQYFYNVADSDLPKLFNTFTFIEKKEIDDIIDFHTKSPERRCGQKQLAEKVVSMLYSQEEANKCIKNCQAHYLNLNETEDLESVLKDCQVTDISDDCLDKISISALCVNQKIISTKAQCKRLIQSGCLFINNNKISEDVVINKDLLLNGRYLVLKTGKKHTHIFQIKKA